MYPAFSFVTPQTTFSAAPEPGVAALLVFDGVKMGATLSLNGVELGTFTDQFLRYQFDITASLQSSNTIEVTFPKNNSIPTEGRFMACSGGWDWAPYSNTIDATGSNTFSKGIWRDVYLVYSAVGFITGLAPQVAYNGPYPTQPLGDRDHAGFTVTTLVQFYAPAGLQGSLTLSGWAESTTVPVASPPGPGLLNVTAQLTAAAVDLWWPNGAGRQPLYRLAVQFTAAPGPALYTERFIGFRTVRQPLPSFSFVVVPFCIVFKGFL